LNRSKRQGFSLIEALVALTIAAIMLTAIFELQQQMIRGQRRASNAIVQVSAQENAIALMRDLNPMVNPTGSIRIPDGDTIRWSSTAVGPMQTNAGFPNGDGAFMVQVFRVSVSIEASTGRLSSPLSFERMGWKRMTIERG